MVTENDQQQAGEQVAKEIYELTTKAVDIESLVSDTEKKVFEASHRHSEEDQISGFCDALNYLPSLGKIMKTVGAAAGFGALLYGASIVMRDGANEFSKSTDLTSGNGGNNLDGTPNLAVDMEIFKASGPIENKALQDSDFISGNNYFENTHNDYRSLKGDEVSDQIKSWGEQGGNSITGQTDNYLEGLNTVDVLDVTDFPTGYPTVASKVKPPKYSQRPTGAPTSEPSLGPTSPTAEPTGLPTAEPSPHFYNPNHGKPTVAPTGVPTGEPTAVPTGEPTGVPTEKQKPEDKPPLPEGETAAIAVCGVVAAAVTAYWTARQCTKGSITANSHRPVLGKEQTQL